MTTEEKAIAYDEALERAKNYCKGHHTDVNPQAAMEYVFPNLKESEDDRIRKELIEFVRQYGDNYYGQISKASAIAWLEKQGEQKQDIMFSVGDRIKRSSTGDIATVSEVDVKNKKYRLCNTGFIPFKYAHLWELVEQKETLCDKCRKTQPSHSCQDITSLGRCALEKQGEENTTDKVKSKFKIGDWVVSNRTSKIYKIDSIDAKDANYITYSCVPSIYTNEDSPCFSESMIHLWTIQDAKDGDVLVIESGKRNNECLFIFKDIADREVLEHCYYRIIDNTFSPTGSFIGYLDNVYHPATKEQRDLLFQKMREAGYEWNADKRKLKKIDSILYFNISSPNSDPTITQKPIDSIYKTKDSVLVDTVRETCTNDSINSFQETNTDDLDYIPNKY